MTAANGVTGTRNTGGSPEGKPPGWKVVLALISLSLTALLWLNGLIASLNRPSVGNDLNRRQLELTVLAEPQLSGRLKPLLSGNQPQQELQKALEQEHIRALEQGEAVGADVALEQALLAQRIAPEEATRRLTALAEQTGVEAEVARTLLETPSKRNADQVQELIAPLPKGGLLRVWSCDALGGGSSCELDRIAERAALQLVLVTVLPFALLLLGSATLVRELWMQWRGKTMRAPVLQGPELNGVDVVLLIAGGFVVVGELLSPLLVAPLLTAVLNGLAVVSPLRDGITVVCLYLTLMAGPLLILALLLKGQANGVLQFRWRPPLQSLQAAAKGFLMVLPLVSLVGWLQTHLWGEGGGSNPLLELVLNSHNIPALLCFGFTAVVLAPLFEETLFRGTLLPVVGRRFGAAAGVLISAAVFAIAHLSLGELLPLLVLGIGLGWLRWNGGRLGSCVLMHALWNGLTFANLVVLGW